MKMILILAAVLSIGPSRQSAATESFEPLAVDEAPPAPVSAARRALDMQRKAPPPVGSTRDLTGAEARTLWHKLLAPKPAPQAATAQP